MTISFRQSTKCPGDPGTSKCYDMLVVQEHQAPARDLAAVSEVRVQKLQQTGILVCLLLGRLRRVRALLGHRRRWCQSASRMRLPGWVFQRHVWLV